MYWTGAGTAVANSIAAAGRVLLERWDVLGRIVQQHVYKAQQQPCSSKQSACSMDGRGCAVAGAVGQGRGGIPTPAPGEPLHAPVCQQWLCVDVRLLVIADVCWCVPSIGAPLLAAACMQEGGVGGQLKVGPA